MHDSTTNGVSNHVLDLIIQDAGGALTHPDAEASIEQVIAALFGAPDAARHKAIVGAAARYASDNGKDPTALAEAAMQKLQDDRLA